MPRHSMKRQGFTLVEMIVALTILSLILLSTMTALSTLAKTQTTLNKRTTQVAQMRAVTSFVRRSLGQAVTVSVELPDRTTSVYFYGSQSNIAWAAPLPIPGGQGGLSALKLYVDDAQQLILLVEPFSSKPTWDNVRPLVLMEGVQAFSIAYKALANNDWVPLWELKAYNTQPAAVKLRLQVNNKYWPELIIALTSGG